MAEWRFPSNDHGETKGINDSGVAMFRGTPLKSLAREICQNSLDVATEKTTIVKFNVFKLDKENIPGKGALLDAFKRSKEYWSGQKAKTTREFFAEAERVIEKDQCDFLRISDFNTSGLTGSREKIGSNWVNLTKSSGVSDKRGTAGGSFGIGKFAPFACSSLSTVFYSTYDENEEKAYQGVSRLVTFTRADEEDTQGVGYFGNENNTPVYEELHLDPNFIRQAGEYGTDIFVAGYKYAGDDWKKELLISVLDGFLGAIWNEKLEVWFGDIVVNKMTLEEIVEEYKDELTGYTEKYYKVLTSENTVWHTEDFYGMGEISLGLLLMNEEGPNRVSMIRQTGMKIMDKDRLPGHVPFMGVLFINGDVINEELRAMENPEHTRWEPERLQNPVRGKIIIKNLNDFIKKHLEALINDGEEDQTDAAGVGNFIPDEMDDDGQKSKVEFISDTVAEIEVKKRKPRNYDNPSKVGAITDETEVEEPGSTGKDGGSGDGTGGSGGGHGFGEGYGEGTGGSGDKGTEGEDGVHGAEKSINIGLQKLIFMCIDKKAGIYVVRLVPDNDGVEGVIELFLSAETQNYPAPLKKAMLLGSGEIAVKEHKLTNITFVKGKELRFKLEMNYYDYCSLEVKLHAVKK